MSLFKKLFSADPAGLEKKADTLYAAGDYGPAKLAYEKALVAAPVEARPDLETTMRRCLDAIARGRIDEAKAYLKQGAIELATQELEGALEVAVDETARAEASALLDGLEAEDARTQAASLEMTDEERIALLMGQWEESQADEYEAHGDDLLRALVMLHKEEVGDALGQLEALLETAAAPRYLWLEIGRARLLNEDLTGGRDALERFVAAMDEGEAVEAQLAANLTLARLADDRGEFEGAMRHFEAALHTRPDDYRPYLAMGAFLRDKGHAQEALDVLRTALELSRTSGTDWRLLEELGLASEQVGKADDARSFFEQVIEFFTNHQIADFPPPTATALARLYESQDRLERAADMYRALSQGSDREHHALYHYEAGRLLQAIGLTDEARRMLTRAQASIGDDDAELAAQIASLLQP
ncbi:MAG TPA: tetratricopeptide repeat protein [Polyangiales bacterium]|nr:tetratricopeptide repeat protein [Polyangiales bacterium]